MFDRRRYLLFAGRLIAPFGGWRDYVDAYESLEDALKVGEGLLRQSAHRRLRWYHVVDRKTLRIVAAGGEHFAGRPRIEV